tara:strand:+ start:11258 stop:11656 length:399 start_codon:yes stop_codon:yes gene_type:complete
MNYNVAQPIEPIISVGTGIPQMATSFNQQTINTPDPRGNLGYLGPPPMLPTASPQKSIGNQQALSLNGGQPFATNPIMSGISKVRADPFPLYENIGQNARSCGNRNAAKNPNLSSQPMLHPTDLPLMTPYSV